MALDSRKDYIITISTYLSLLVFCFQEVKCKILYVTTQDNPLKKNLYSPLDWSFQYFQIKLSHNNIQILFHTISTALAISWLCYQSFVADIGMLCGTTPTNNYSPPEYCAWWPS